MELCTRENLFLLDKMWINDFFKVFKRLRDSVRKKRPQMWSSGDWVLHHDNAPAHTALSVQQVLVKTTWRLSLILPIHPILRHATSSCSLVGKARWKGNVLLMSAKWRRKRWRYWTTSAPNSSRNVFSSGKKVGTSVSSQKERILKETRVVMV